MKVLIAEDDPNTLTPYKIALEARCHEVITTDNGQDCARIYREEFDRWINERKNKNEEIQQQSQSLLSSSPFDAVVLDYRMPKKDGMEVAKEILNINPNQRIIFASTYVKDTLQDAVKELKMAVELMQKPFKVQALVDTIEDTQIYDELRKLNVDSDAFKAVNPTHEQISSLLEAIRRIQKERTF